MMDKESKIYVAGSGKLVGAAIVRQLELLGYQNICGIESGEIDLTDEVAVESFFAKEGPEYVFLAAGKSGGILANQKYPADLIRDNLLTECHVIHSAYKYGATKLLYLASSCSYPRDTAQPMQVSQLYSGPLEPTNKAYAIAKIAGIELCEAYSTQYQCQFISGIPADAFGPNADFSLENSHVVAALIRKMHEANRDNLGSVEIWGTGNPRREFIFADDLANACIFTMRQYDGPGVINIGGGHDISIRDLAVAVKSAVGFEGELVFDTSKPDGMPYKALDSSYLTKLGWSNITSLPEALKITYDWFLQEKEKEV